MKKNILLFFIFLFMCFLTGCAKNYTSVSEYTEDMRQVRNKLGDYTVEGTLSVENKKMGYVKVYIKGKRWRVDGSYEPGVYRPLLFCDGDKIYASLGNNMVKEVPLESVFKLFRVDTVEKKELVLSSINPVGILFNWDIDKINNDNIDIVWTFIKKDKKNNFNCRLLKYNKANNSEICINDDYGMGVYAKMFTPDKGLIEINAKKIDNTPIPENEIDLPANSIIVPSRNLYYNYR